MLLAEDWLLGHDGLPIIDRWKHGIAAMLTPGDLIEQPDFALGSLTISPSRRMVLKADESRLLEPRMMQVLVLLARDPGQVVSRQRLFDEVWGVPVGEDSLNRAVAGVRKALELDSDRLSLETIPRTGYRLDIAIEDDAAGGGIDRRWLIGGSVAAVAALGAAVFGLRNHPSASELEAASLREQGQQIIREALATRTDEAVKLLERATGLDPENAHGWGLLAFAYRDRGEGGNPDVVTQSIQRSERAATKALAIDPHEGAALAALALLRPEFGDWLNVERKLLAGLQVAPNSVELLTALGLIYQSVGRARDGFIVNDKAVRIDPMSVTAQFRSALKNWILGDLPKADQVLGRALSVWPSHPIFWNTRLIVYAYSNRPAAALEFVESQTRPASLTQEFIDRWLIIIRALLARTPAEKARTRANLVEVAASTRSFASNGMMAFSSLGMLDEAFDLAYGYYRGTGDFATAFAKREGLPVNDMNWRRTMMLFTPPCAAMRKDPRFMQLAQDIGLADYWEKSGTKPDPFFFV